MKKSSIAILLILLSSGTWAKPYIPADENQILIEIEQSTALRELKSLRQAFNNEKGNLSLLSRIIARYIKLGREHADERYFSYAEALLTPLVQTESLDITLKVQWADILQRQHQFVQAQQVLDQVLTLHRGHAQARLMRAVIYQAKGQYSLAMKDCKALLGRVELLVSTTCITQIDGLQGHLQRSIPLLQRTLEQYSNSDDETLRWSRTVLAEMLIRAGKPEQASHYLEAVQQSQTLDVYALAIKADMLIQQGRYRETMSLLEPHKQIGKLLLRFVIASNMAGQAYEQDLENLSAIIERSRLLPGSAHLRFLARYYLDVEKNPPLALTTARVNWQQQREPDDALLLARSLLAVQDYTALQAFRQELLGSGLADQRIETVFHEGRS